MTTRTHARGMRLLLSSFTALVLAGKVVLCLTSSIGTSSGKRSASIEENTKKNLTFGLINGGSEFFEPVAQGFLLRCNQFGVTCHIRSSDDECEEARSRFVAEFLENYTVDAIAMKPCSRGKSDDLINRTVDAGIPIVTLDSDAPESKRSAYIGTDQDFLGRTMARLLRQLRPEGGTFAVIAPKEGRMQGFLEEITLYNGREDRAHWHNIGPESDDDGEGILHMDEMEKYAEMDVTALVTMKQTPMKDANWTQFVEKNRHRGITYIGTDGDDFQLDYLSKRYVDGLVGQLPHEMGTTSFEVLHELVTNGPNHILEKDFYPTNIVSYNLIPTELPPRNLNENLLGNLKYIGFIGFGLIAVAVMACICWTCLNRSSLVVCAAQPFFLIMVAVGVLIMSGSLIPLSFDDGGEDDSFSHAASVGICMSTPWFAFVGFSVTFAALFSKTWRVNRIFGSEGPIKRVEVHVNDVLAPFLFLLTCNIAVLLAWTFKDPLIYKRHEHGGTDYWNRVISTYGACHSENVVAYLVPLAVINFSVLATACWQALQARDIEEEFSEAKYIGLAVGSLFQAFLTGIPVVVVVRDMPRTFYVVLSLMIIVLCVAVLLLIFLPKVFMQQSYAAESPVQQKRRLRESIRRSSAISSLEFSRKSYNGSRSRFLHNEEDERSSSNMNVTSNQALCPMDSKEKNQRTNHATTESIGDHGASEYQDSAVSYESELIPSLGENESKESRSYHTSEEEEQSMRGRNKWSLVSKMGDNNPALHEPEPLSQESSPEAARDNHETY